MRIQKLHASVLSFSQHQWKKKDPWFFPTYSIWHTLPCLTLLFFFSCFLIVSLCICPSRWNILMCKGLFWVSVCFLMPICIMLIVVLLTRTGNVTCLFFFQCRKYTSEQTWSLRYCCDHVYKWLYGTSQGGHDFPLQYYCWNNWDGGEDSTTRVGYSMVCYVANCQDADN